MTDADVMSKIINSKYLRKVSNVIECANVFVV